MLNPVWLNTFKTLIEIGHFTQTAEKLFMTQPGVSQHIKKLEAACGHDLIKRINKQFELTEQGRMVYDYALRVAAEEQQLLDSLSFDDPFEGTCRVSCSGSLALWLYPHLLTLQKAHPKLTMSLEVAPNYKILDGLQAGTVDLGIVTHIPNPSLYNSRVLGQEPLCLALPTAMATTPVTPDSLKTCGAVMHPDAAHYLSLYFEQCGNAEFANMNVDDVPAVSYINQLSQILLPVAEGIGFTVLPQSAIHAFPRKEELAVHTPESPVVETLYLVTKRNRDLPARYQQIIHALEAKFAAE
ncbi:LysR family transcriptional regulator [Photobacterium aphoticum]|uniref:LysR family transcriptional regulator n=1 Tax=Photobacterium aphoticum TaxID=754436 RepID=A0A0J1GKB9_9GAMM|nr:LysR family transcriptional regulator [Photobacterium aphoticum]KLU99903.1 LysR family transcriptional regulator [Photobacterium aphoticum]PSU56848.1 LysR family transcriptional regulator [Photobacterium aphoticum]GHA40942.1 LysR family transcriptional regulator [Photobacterium aphoticum]